MSGKGVHTGDWLRRLESWAEIWVVWGREGLVLRAIAGERCVEQ